MVAQYFTHESILRGLMLTIFLTVASMALGTLLGLGLAIMRSSSMKPVAIAAGIYITLFRGTPVLVQLIFWFNISALYPNLTIGIPFTDIGTAIDMNALMAPDHRGPGRPDAERGRLHGRDHPRRVLLGRQGPDRGRRLPRA